MNYEKFFKEVYRLPYNNDVVNWYSCIMELLEFKKQCNYTKDINNIHELAKEYLINFNMNRNTVVKKCWEKMLSKQVNDREYKRSL